MDLYRQVPPPGENISISVQPFQVEDLVPMEDEIEWAFRRLRNHRSRCPSGMRAEHLKGWLAEAQKEEVAVGKVIVAEGEVEDIGGPGGEDMEE